MTFFLKALGAALTAIQSPTLGPTDPITIDQAADIAARNAFSVRLQASTVERNRQRINEAKGNLGPKVSASAVYTRYGEAVTTQFSPTSPPVTIQPIDTRTGTLSLQLPIDISGNLNRQVRAAEATYRASQQSLVASMNDARLNAKQAFLQVLRANALVGVQQQAVRDAEERLNQGQRLLAGAQVARVDVTRLEAAVAQARSDLLTAQNNLTLAKNAFNLSLARPIETPVNLVDLTNLPAAPMDPEPLVRLGQTRRPEVRSLIQSLEALANIRRATEGGMNPSLNVGVNYQRNLDAAGFSAQSATTVGTLTLGIPIFDSGVTRARVKQARQDEEQARINLEQVQLGISQDVRSAFANLGSALARLNNAREQVRLAEEVYRLAVIRQQAAEGTYVEVVDAESQLTQARNGLVSARYDYLQAYSQLQRAIGTDDVAGAAQGTGTASPTGGGSR